MYIYIYMLLHPPYPPPHPPCLTDSRLRPARRLWGRTCYIYLSIYLSIYMYVCIRMYTCIIYRIVLLTPRPLCTSGLRLRLARRFLGRMCWTSGIYIYIYIYTHTYIHIHVLASTPPITSLTSRPLGSRLRLARRLWGRTSWAMATLPSSMHCAR